MKKNLFRANTPCPCGSEVPYGECCGLWHTAFADSGPAGLRAPTPEALMRSRYSAYVLSLADYLLATWHPSTSPGELELYPTKWLGLEILHAQSSAEAGVIEYVARLRDSNGRAQRIHEISRFVRELGVWLYVDGQMQHPNVQDPNAA